MGISFIRVSILINPFSSLFHVFLGVCFVQDLHPDLDKLSPRSVKCVFIGYSRTQKKYRCYDSVTRKYHTSADVTFFESTPYFSNGSPDIPIDHPSLPQPVAFVEPKLFMLQLNHCRCIPEDKSQAPIFTPVDTTCPSK